MRSYRSRSRIELAIGCRATRVNLTSIRSYSPFIHDYQAAIQTKIPGDAFGDLLVLAGLGDREPDLVGILASVTDPANAAELGLSEDQVARLEALIKQHESKALDFASQLRGCLQGASLSRRWRMFDWWKSKGSHY